jgi:hypothetical protein
MPPIFYFRFLKIYLFWKTVKTNYLGKPNAGTHTCARQRIQKDIGERKTHTCTSPNVSYDTHKKRLWSTCLPNTIKIKSNHKSLFSFATNWLKLREEALFELNALSVSCRPEKRRMCYWKPHSTIFHFQNIHGKQPCSHSIFSPFGSFFSKLGQHEFCN